MIVAALPFVLFQCDKPENENRIPSIDFQEFVLHKNSSGKDSMIILSINYKDENGDLGLSSGDTSPPFHYGGEGFYNLYIAYYVKNPGGWQKILNPITLDTIHFNQRFPRLNPTPKVRKVSGIMSVNVPASPYPGIKPADIRFRLHILDRELNRSNAVESGEIHLQH